MSEHGNAILTFNPIALPKDWRATTLGKLLSEVGVFIDGDWVERKDQDPNGDVRLIQLADVGEGEYRNRSKRYLTSLRARELSCTFLQQHYCTHGSRCAQRQAAN